MPSRSTTNADKVREGNIALDSFEFYSLVVYILSKKKSYDPISKVHTIQLWIVSSKEHVCGTYNLLFARSM